MIFGIKSDRGFVRQNNEDSFFVNNVEGIFIVGDGLGGNEGGEIASKIGTDIVGKLLSENKIEFEGQGNPIDDILKKANNQIIATGIRENLKNMGTTIVIAKCLDLYFYIVSVGDSRAYLWAKSKGEIKQLTEDDSLVNTMVKTGEISEEEARSHPLKNIITSYLGSGSFGTAAVKKFEWCYNDYILLCTDGLSNMISDSEIYSIISENCVNDPQRICDLLVARANEKGGYDNITVIVIKNDIIPKRKIK